METTNHSQISHTPGPFVEESRTAPYANVHGSVTINSGGPDGYSFTVSARDAAIILATSELLETLKEYVTAFVRGDKMRFGIEVEKSEGRVTPALAFYRKACAVIAKAEGKA